MLMMHSFLNTKKTQEMENFHNSILIYFCHRSKFRFLWNLSNFPCLLVTVNPLILLFADALFKLRWFFILDRQYTALIILRWKDIWKRKISQVKKNLYIEMLFENDGFHVSKKNLKSIQFCHCEKWLLFNRLWKWSQYYEELSIQ